MAAAQLPHEVLTQILQHIPLGERLGSCGLLSVAWAAAAITATDTIQLDELQEPACFAAWLQLHGAQVSSIDIEDGQEQKLWHLPCRNLRALSLESCEVQLCHSTTAGGRPGRCTGHGLGKGTAGVLGSSQAAAQQTAHRPAQLRGAGQQSAQGAAAGKVTQVHIRPRTVCTMHSRAGRGTGCTWCGSGACSAKYPAWRHSACSSCCHSTSACTWSAAGSHGAHKPCAEQLQHWLLQAAVGANFDPYYTRAPFAGLRFQGVCGRK